MPNKSARQKINRKKRMGVRSKIGEYFTAINKTFYDESLLQESLGDFLEKTGQNNLQDAFLDYLQRLSAKTAELLKKARELLSDAYTTGSKRIQDQDGETLSFDEVEDENAINILVQKQEQHYKDLTKRQSRVVDQTISQGLKRGRSYEQIAKDIQMNVRQTTHFSALRIARSEIVAAHSFGQTETMSKAGIEEYSIITSENYKGKDGKTYPCKVCRSVSGPRGREHRYKVSQAGTAQGPLPVTHTHPNCNCVVVARTK